MIFLNKIKLHNFISFEDVEFEISNGTFLVLGDNLDSEFTKGNGAGKSSLFEGIIYALYGKADRNLQRYNTKDTYVELYMMVDGLEVKIIRYYNHHKNKNKVFLFINDEEYSAHTQKQTQEKINSIISYSYDHFVSSVIVKQGMQIKLTTLSPVKRKEYFVSMLDFDFDKIHKKSKSVLETLRNSYLEKEREFNKIKSELSFLEGKKEGILSSLQGQNNDKEKAVALNKEVMNINKELHSLPDIKSVQDIRKQISAKESEISVYSKTKNDLQQLKDNKVCPLCNSQVNISSIEEDLSNVIARIQQLFQELKSLKDKEKELSELIDKRRQLEFKKQTLLNQIKEIISKDTDTSELDELQLEIDKLKERVDELDSDLFFISDDIVRYETIEQLFRPSGEIRSISLKSYIDLYNDILSYYMISLFPEKEIRFELDDKAQGIDIKGVDYNSLSGGEKRRIDIVIQLSFSDFIATINKTSFNLLVLDESFDGIDFDAVSNIVSFLVSYYENKSIYVITHNENIKQYFHNVLKITKQNGISSIETISV